MTSGYGFVADGELHRIADDDVAAAQRLLQRRVPEPDRPVVAAMLGIAS